MAPSSTLTVSVYKFLNLINKWSLYLVLLIWPFGHLLKFANIYFLDIASFLVFVSFVLGDNFYKYKKTLLFKSLNLFWFSLLVSILYALWQQNLSTPSTNFFYYIRVLVYPFLSFAYFTHKSLDLTRVSAFSVATFVLLGLAQYFLLPDLRLYKYLGFDDHYYRLAGTLLDPNFTGAILATIAIYALISKKYLLSTLLTACLTLTFSRASYLSFLVALVAFIIYKKNLKLLWLLPALLIFIYFSPKPFGEGVNLLRTYSITSRIVSISSGLQTVKANPALGVAFGHSASVDNSYIYLLAGSGVLGLTSFFFTLYSVLKTTNKATFVLLLPILTHSLFNNSFFYIWIMSLFWVLVGYSFKENKSI